MNCSFRLVLVLAAVLIFGLPAGVDAQTNNYIVQFEDPPLALFAGNEIRGANLEPTNPQARIEAGLDAVPRLQPRSQASQVYLSFLDGRHNVLLSAIGQRLGREPDVLFRYRASFNGMAMALTGEEAGKIAKLPGVKQVEEEVIYHINTDRGPAFIGADNVWNGNLPGGVGSKGEGVVMGVLDSGLNLKSNHSSFAATGDDGFTHTNPLGEGVFRGWCNPDDRNFDRDLQCNAKVIGAYSFTQDNTPDDENGHGSHVASTAAGNVVNRVMVPRTGIEVNVSGVAPHANIIMYEVCDDTFTGGCPGGALQAGLDQIVLDADVVDVANFSIGGPSANPWTDGLSQALLAVREAGIAVATSAGNSGPFAATVGSPAVAPWTTAVAAQTHDRLFFNASVSITGPDVPPPGLTGLAALQGTGPAFSGVVTAAIGLDENNPAGCSAFPFGAFTDQIALIRRGGCNFSDKVENAANAGAIATVVFNNVAGTPILMAGLEPTTIPSVMLGNADGLGVRDWINANPGATGRIDPSAMGSVLNSDFGDLMAGFSSRGPNGAVSDILKPNISAPGVAIFAALGNRGSQGDEWGMISGTSMASPHVAGTMALIRAIQPRWTPAEIHSAIVMTAQNADTIVKEDGTTPADPFDFGGGRVSPAHAVQAGLVLNETTANFAAADPALGGEPAQLNLPDLTDADCIPDCIFTRTVRNTLDEPAEWEVVADQPEGFRVTIAPASFTLAAGAVQELTVTATPLNNELGESFRFGAVRLTNVSPGRLPELSLAVALRGTGPVDRPIITVDPNSFAITLETGDTGDEALVIGNSGTQPLNWSISFGSGADCGAPPPLWISVDPVAGTTNAGAANGVTLDIDTAELPIGRHEATLCIESNDLLNAEVLVPVRLTVAELVQEADLAVALAASKGVLASGETIGYTLEVHNAGPRDLAGATIFSALGAAFSTLAWTCQTTDVNASCSTSGSGEINELVNLPRDASMTFQIEAVLGGDTGPDTQVTSSVVGILPENLTDPDTSNNLDAVTVQFSIFTDGFE